MRYDGQGYLARPNKDGEIVRWRGASHGDKIAMKKYFRRQEAKRAPEQSGYHKNEGYTPAELRAVRAVKGVGRPVHA